jgi:uncharacterized protein
MSQQENLRIVRGIYNAVGRGDVPAILDRVADDVDWSAEAESHAAPWYGARVGKAGVASFFTDLAGSIEITEFTPPALPPGRTMSTCSSGGRSSRSPPAGRHR